MRILLSVLLCLIFVQDYSGTARRPDPRNIRIRLEPVRLDPTDPARRQVGPLHYLEGVEIVERGSGIGGYSAMSVAGDRITLLSDGGNALRFRWLGGSRVADVQSWALPDGPGRGWGKFDRDSESMAVDPTTGTAWVGFERHNQIWRYDADLRHAKGRARPKSMKFFDDNGGAETLARLHDGRFVLLSETRYDECGGEHCGIIFARDPVDAPEDVVRFRYKTADTDDYLPVDAAELPDGRLLVLERAFGPPYGFSSRLSVIDPRQVRGGELLTGKPIATLARPLIHDNFEGVAVTREGGRTIVWLVSDDNQFFLQRTLLLKFELVG